MMSYVVSPLFPDIEGSVRLITRSFMQEEPGRRALMLDLSNAGSPSAAGLGQLVALHHRLLRSGGKLVLCNVGDTWHDVLTVTHLTKLLDVRRHDAYAAPDAM